MTCKKNSKFHEYVRDIYRAPRGTTKEYITDRLQKIWNHDKGSTLVALMFYVRNISVITEDVCHGVGRGEKLIAWYIALWLLKNHDNMFMANYLTFIDMGCLRDCLVLAKMAIKEGLNKYKIVTCLSPLAMMLMNDTKTIQMGGGKLSMAHKWAPRQGKSFSQCIPYLKKICKLEGYDSDKQWRLYIRNIASRANKTVETKLSSKCVENINFSDVPRSALKLYATKFMSIPQTQNLYFRHMCLKMNKENRDDAWLIASPHKTYENGVHGNI